MSLSRWNVYKSGVFAVGLELDAPIRHTASLKIDTSALAASSAEVMANLVLNSSYNRGFTQGSIRTLIKPMPEALSNSHNALYALNCMQSTYDLTGQSGEAFYSAGLWIGATPEWRIVKYTDGYQASTGVTVLQSGDTTLSPTTDGVYAVQLSWVYDLSVYGGCYLALAVGTSETFADLTTIYETVDATAPLAESVAEDPGLADNEGTGSAHVVLFDETTVSGLP